MEDRPAAGMAETLAPGLLRVIAPNPSPMTHWGTNTYLLGHETLAVIDPGPRDDSHLEAILRAAAGRPITHILVTHAHLDHSPLARPLAAATGAPVLAFGPAAAGRSAAMRALADAEGIGGGEGVDCDFAPDTQLSDGTVLNTGAGPLVALHTPGHMGNHLTFLVEGAAFSGDLAMGWASTLISPPDGDVTDFLASCARLKQAGARRLYPGHGAPVADGPARLNWLIAHRRSRETQILAALSDGPGTAAELADRIYRDVSPALMQVAARNVLAHLVALHGVGRALCAGPISSTATWSHPESRFSARPSGRPAPPLL